MGLRTQQARQQIWPLKERDPPIRFLIHDKDGKFAKAFDTVLRSEGIKVIKVIHTPYRAPNANAYAERWVRSVREERLDRVLIMNGQHLSRVMKEYVAYYNSARPHQGLDQQSPIPRSILEPEGPVQCRDVLGGIIHDYYRKAA